jgi:CPA2 family monovalent cation:H+ antiporter-2
LSLGAFLAGLIVSESRFSHLAFGEILPLQILFSATFFVSVGLLFDVGFLLENPLLMLGVVAAVLVIKALTTVASLMTIGYGATSAACVGLGLAQVGEFSFVLERTGRSLGMFPAGAAEGGPEAFIGATVVLMVATPFLYGLGARMRERFAQPQPQFDASEHAADTHGARELSGHVIIAGLGDAGRQVAHVLHEEGVPYVCITLSPDGAREAEQWALRVLRGNYTRRHELELAGIETARSLMVADDDHETTHRVVALARSLRPDLDIVARIHAIANGPDLRAAGATDVIAQDAESIAALAARVLGDVDEERRELHRRRIRAGRTGVSAVALGEEARARGCEHVADTTEVTPSATGCTECLSEGGTWIHLRICMTCGHVGCCDSSPKKHASQHHEESGHPVVRSFEPGEDWAWCYLHEKRF